MGFLQVLLYDIWSFSAFKAPTVPRVDVCGALGLGCRVALVVPVRLAVGVLIVGVWSGFRV